MTNYLNTGNVEQNPFYEAIRSGYLYNPQIQGKMRAAAFMSGSGSNFKEIYKTQQNLETKLGKESPFEIVAVFTDTEKGYENAGRIITDVTGKVDTIPRIYLNPDKIIPRYKEADKNERNFLRGVYDREVISTLTPHNINFAILAGYMRLLSENLIQRIACVNVHPGPLNVIDPFTGKRKFTGDSAVKKQILARREYLQSTVNVAREGADTGEILMLSQISPVDLKGHTLEILASNESLFKEIIDENQSRLKEVGDLDIFPKAVTFAASGLYRFNKNWQLRLHHPQHSHVCSLQLRPENAEPVTIRDYHRDLINQLIHYSKTK